MPFVARRIWIELALPTPFRFTGSSIFSAGRNTYGALGVGDSDERSQPVLFSLVGSPFRVTPTMVGGDLSFGVFALDAGRYHSLFVLLDGRVFSTGGEDPNRGLLGVGDSVNRCFPISKQT